MTTRIRTTIVGSGVIGHHHAIVLAGHDGFEVIGLVDGDTARADEVAAELAALDGTPRPAVFADLAAALDDSHRPDLVVICTPSGTHIDLARQAMDAGIHTVIEKPLDVDLGKARAFAAEASAAEARGIHVSVISQHRFDPASVVIREAIDEGRFDLVTSATATVPWWRTQEYYDSGDWRGTWALDGGGAVMNQGVHTVDLLRWFLGRPTGVFAYTACLGHERVEVEDAVSAVVRFESGALATIHATTAAYPGGGARLHVHGTGGTAMIDDSRLDYFHSRHDGDRGSIGALGGAQPENTAANEVDLEETTTVPAREDAFVIGHARQYDAIARSIETGVQHSVSVEEALLSLALVRAIYASATLGREVSFDEVLSGQTDRLTLVTSMGR